MNEAMTMEPTAEEAARMEAELSAIFAEIDRIDARIEINQKETEQIRAETRKILDQLKAR